VKSFDGAQADGRMAVHDTVLIEGTRSHVPPKVGRLACGRIAPTIAIRSDEELR
jgi:hypothetical protein